MLQHDHRFERWINIVKELDADLSGCHTGTLSKKMVNKIMVNLEVRDIKIRRRIKKRLKARIGKETDLTDCIPGKLTDDDAQKIIKRYNAAMKRKDDALKGIKKD